MKSPYTLFKDWFNAAQAAGIPMPEAMTLATATPKGVPAARIVLLKSVERDGFVFFTNYESRKAGELARNPRAALVFYWQPLERQVRIEGRISRVSAAESNRYFATRPRESQIGAWASQQSRTLKTRAELEKRFWDLNAKYEGATIPRPPHWGGFKLVPERIEFWQGREHRLHERTLYQRRGGKWSTSILAP